MKSSRVCWRPGPSGFSRNKYTPGRGKTTRSRVGCTAFLSFGGQDAAGWRPHGRTMDGALPARWKVIAGWKQGGLLPDSARLRLAQHLLYNLSFDDTVRHCTVLLGEPNRMRVWQQMERERWQRRRVVWLYVNGEDRSGQHEWVRQSDRLSPSHHVVMLGPWWNETTRDHFGERVSSMWVPFGSLSFTERQLHTPLDMDSHRKAAAGGSSACAGGEKTGNVLYVQSNCSPFRERLWDALNSGMLEAGLGPGHYLGKCNGFRKLGVKWVDSQPERQGRRDLSRNDELVSVYCAFHLALTMEHNTNGVGYITEKVPPAQRTRPSRARCAKDIHVRIHRRRETHGHATKSLTRYSTR